MLEGPKKSIRRIVIYLLNAMLGGVPSFRIRRVALPTYSDGLLRLTKCIVQ